jgi:hypothetical protein
MSVGGQTITSCPKCGDVCADTLLRHKCSMNNLRQSAQDFYEASYGERAVGAVYQIIAEFTELRIRDFADACHREFYDRDIPYAAWVSMKRVAKEQGIELPELEK